MAAQWAALIWGVGGAISPLLIDGLIHSFGWRHAFEIIGALILVLLSPISQWVTRSTPHELNLVPDGILTPAYSNVSVFVDEELAPKGT